MVRGKVIDAKRKPFPNVTIVVESLGGIGRKLTTKTDKKGEFVQLLTAVGHVSHHRDRSEDRLRQQRHRASSLGKASEMMIVLVPSTAANDAAKAAELKKTFEEGVTASRAGQHDVGDREVQRRARDFAGLLRLPVQHRRRADGEEGREGARKRRGRRRSR